MNTNYQNINLPKEEKIAEGIYITKPQPKTEQTPQQKYVFRSTAELINILENDFESIADQIKMLYEANEEMLKFDPNDYDLIEARQENLEIINRKLLRMKEIQNELKGFCPTNPLVIKNVFEYFQKDEMNVDSKNEKEEEITDMTNVNNNKNVIQSIDL